MVKHHSVILRTLSNRYKIKTKVYVEKKHDRKGSLQSLYKTVWPFCGSISKQDHGVSDHRDSAWPFPNIPTGGRAAVDTDCAIDLSALMASGCPGLGTGDHIKYTTARPNRA